MGLTMNSRPGTSSIAVTATAFVLLVVMALLMGGSVRRESVTVDEIAHIGAGVSYLQKLDLRMNEEHPPLAKVLAVVPLMMRGVHADYSNLSWSFSSRFMMQYLGEWVWGHWLITRWNDSVVIVFWARMPMLLLTLAMGLVLYRLGAKLGSPVGGLLCLCAYCTMPAFLTFGPLVLTDTAVTFFSLLTLWALADLWRSPTRVAMLRLGLALGGALLSKFSAGLLFICFGAFALSLRLRALPEQPTERTELRAWRRQRRFALTQSTLLAAIVVYGVYFILSWNEPTGSFSMIPHFPASPLLRRLLMPPWLYLRGLATFALTARALPPCLTMSATTRSAPSLLEE